MANKTTKTDAASAKPSVDRTEPEGEHVDLMTPAEETKMREQATKPAAVKAALAEGKKDPIAKFGDPDADQADGAARRANFG